MNIEQVKACTVFETLGGSHAYGTNTVGSDIDYRGVCIPKDPAYYVGSKVFEQKDNEWPEDEDKVIFDFRKAVKLMADGNPNMVDLLFTDERHWLMCEDSWRKVVEKRDLFLSKKMRFTYGGYAYQQLKRIERHRGYLINPPSHKPTRKEFDLPEKKLVSKEQMGEFQWLLAKVLQDGIELMKVSPETRQELYGINYIGAVQAGIPEEAAQVVKKLTGASDSFIEVIFKEKRYDNAMKGWNAYQNWKKKRNPKRQVLESKYGYDTKHAMHLVRLMRMGVEILGEGKVLVSRPDAKELLAIRNGAWTYDKVVEFAAEYDKKLDALYKTSSLPKDPPRDKIDDLCVSIVKEEVFGSPWPSLPWEALPHG